jgi:short subunit dehydrogenase-like uncharacterized protein
VVSLFLDTMSNRAFDIIIFGATGFTGQLVAKHIHAQNVDMKWAIAGRSQSKLSSLMTVLVNMQAPRNLPDILIADATDCKALSDICGEARIILNCTGPFRFLGKEVVEACLKAKCTYMDICGEPQFMEKCFLDYHEKAVESGVLIIHACAFDSVPADLGALFSMRQFGPSKCASIESFLTIDCPKGLKGHVTTYESAVHGVGDLGSLKEIRREIKKKYNPPSIRHIGKKIAKVSTYKFESRMDKYVIPFMGSDASVVRSSHRALAMRTGEHCWPQYSACVTVNDLYTVAATSFYGSMFYTLSGNPWGRSLLLSYPELFSDGIFSKAGPSAEQLENTSFKMFFFAHGYATVPESDDVDKEGGIEESEKKRVARGEATLLPSQVAGTARTSKMCSFSRIFKGKKDKDGAVPVPYPEDDLPCNKEVCVVVSGPEPGYVATPSIFFALAQCVLDEREKMPKGGVLTPSAAFYDSATVFARLKRAGLMFDVVNSGEEEVEQDKEEQEETGEGIVLGVNEERIIKSELRQDNKDDGVRIG